MIRYLCLLSLCLTGFAFADPYRDHLNSEKTFLANEIKATMQDDVFWGYDENLYFTLGRYLQVSADLDAYDSGVYYQFHIPLNSVNIGDFLAMP